MRRKFCQFCLLWYLSRRLAQIQSRLKQLVQSFLFPGNLAVVVQTLEHVLVSPSGGFIWNTLYSVLRAQLAVRNTQKLFEGSAEPRQIIGLGKERPDHNDKNPFFPGHTERRQSSFHFSPAVSAVLDTMFLIGIILHEWSKGHDRYDMFDKRCKHDDHCASSVDELYRVRSSYVFQTPYVRIFSVYFFLLLFLVTRYLCSSELEVLQLRTEKGAAHNDRLDPPVPAECSGAG